MAFYIHITCVSISITLFTVRGLWMLLDHPLLTHKIVKILPHIIDTALLTSAIYLAFNINQYPFVDGWLTAKLLALLAYIGLGIIALGRGKTKRIRLVALIFAILTFSYIVSVAMTHNPLGILSVWVA
ncbi:MAG: SirB2 family protein [Pseudomonadales bacterium]|nr:SirB2 family protein [Pseudomonadales bacterium]